MTLEERGNSPDYANKYRWIQEVFASKDPNEVSQMETHLINTYINWARCDNEKDGAASIYDHMADDAIKCYVYIVWRYSHNLAANAEVELTTNQTRRSDNRWVCCTLYIIRCDWQIFKNGKLLAFYNNARCLL